VNETTETTRTVWNPNAYWRPVAVVTGAASGIGLATVQLLTDRGGRAVAVDLSAEALTAFDGNPAVRTLVGDVTDEAVNAAAVALAEQTWGRLDTLVLNAGVRGSGPIDTVDLDVFERSIDVNLRAVVLGMRVGVPALRRAGGGAIVVTSSNTGLAGEANRWPYAAAKAGVINLARSVAIDLGPEGIRVNAVCPGPTITGMTAQVAAAQPERWAQLQANVPQRRWALAEEVAEAIIWLASPAASFVTGVALPVDGGVTANTGQA
jgi:meso-butanediol dehydrogenase / (S,S)-butanediol dehydrogenase / diacetyl reductase